MSLEITGKLIEKQDTVNVNDRFRKREFVLELTDEVNGNTYTNFGKFQCVQAKCDILDKFNIGDELKVSFNVKGNRWEKDGKVSYITNLDAWRVEKVGENATEQAQQANVNPTTSATPDNLPF